MNIESQKLNRLINGYVYVYISENRYFLGKFLCYDEHLNLVLSECEEFKKIEGFEQKRTHGLITIRGSNIISIEASSIPPLDRNNQSNNMFQTGIGTIKPFGRGYL